MFRGTLDSLNITNLEAAWLDGSVKGPLKISWVEGVSVQGKLQARKLNPSILNPEWKGELNLNLEGKFLSPPAGRAEASFRVGLLESRFFRKGSSPGTWKAAGKENLLNIDPVFACAGRASISRGRGLLQERLSLEGSGHGSFGIYPGSEGSNYGVRLGLV